MEDARAKYDAAIAALVAGLGEQGLDAASLVGRCCLLPGHAMAACLTRNWPLWLLRVSSTLLSSSSEPLLCVPMQPEVPHGSDVRGMVAAAIEEARRIPEAPPVPINYSSLQRSIQEWIEQLEGTNSDVAAAQQVCWDMHLLHRPVLYRPMAVFPALCFVGQAGSAMGN